MAEYQQALQQKNTIIDDLKQKIAAEGDKYIAEI